MTTPAPATEIVRADDVEKRYGLEKERMYLESGWLGRIFGSPSSAPMNIAGLVASVFTLAAVLLLFFPGSVSALDYLEVIAPVITLVLGYLFGKKQ